MTIVTWLLGLAFSIQANNETVAGAWQRTDQNGTQVLLIRDNYFSLTEYNLAEKKFLKTTGGVFRLNQGKASLVVEFDSDNKDAIGRKDEIPFVVDGDKLQFSFAGYGGEWKQVDYGQAPLAGNWRISGRMEEGQMNPIPKRDRKTLKLLTGNRFQWFAINPATREFFGTGGGTYRFENGKYVETIEFFSRDGSRVGASLEFDGRVDGDNWYHSGKSSKGDPLNEVWSREKDQ